jgi:hypothetical protein
MQQGNQPGETIMSDEESGFLVPPGLSDQFSKWFDDNYAAALNYLGQLPGPMNVSDGTPLLLDKRATVIEMSNELLMDMGVIPDTRPPLPPPSWRTRLRWKRDQWRESAARRAYRLIAGCDVPDPE